MSTTELPAGGTEQTAATSYNLLLTTFIATIFVSAALLFAVQPMFTKMVLPRLGGAPAVWSVAMVFFQTALLAGYIYAHLLTRFAPGRPSVIIHLVVTALACFWLPFSISTGWGRPPETGEAFWLLAVFGLSIGPPFFALAANAPLIQAWFARTGHPSAHDPYFLYAASNVGSFLALLSYPIAVEPFVPLSDQRWYWTGGFYVLLLLIAACGLLMLRSVNQAPSAIAINSDDVVAGTEEAAPPSWLDVVSWIGLAAVPSGLLIAVTAHIATDVASVPLFWVVPLSLYLLTFVIVFQTRPIIPHWLVVRLYPFVILAFVVVLMMLPIELILTQVAMHLGVFALTALLCHGELARRRPPPRYLTAYYMWISVGGMIGGILTGLVAPHVFKTVAEYQILIVLALLCRPGFKLPKYGDGDYSLLIGLGIGALLLVGLKGFDAQLEIGMFGVLLGFLVGLSIRYWNAVIPFAAIVAFLFFMSFQFQLTDLSNFRVRNFFGVLDVRELPDGRFRTLWHGTTGQGTQRIRDENGRLLTGRPEMISEFFAGAGIDQVFQAVRAKVGGPTNIAVVGMGTGSLACTRRPGDTLTYYELDADIIRIARDPRYFSFVHECAPDMKTVRGDARLTLEDAPDASYDLIFIDAFIGAAIPIHLLTQEAMALYLRKIKPGGMVAMHVSNKNLELATVVAGIAEANGVICRIYDGGDVENNYDEFLFVPRVAAVARTNEDFGALAKSEFWPIQERDFEPAHLDRRLLQYRRRSDAES